MWYFEHSLALPFFGIGMKTDLFQSCGHCWFFPIWNQSAVPCPVLTAASWPAYRFLRRQVRWSGILISLRIFRFVVIHIVKGFSIVNEAEVDVFLEFSCFFYDPMDVGNLISGSSVFSKSSWVIWKFSVHVGLKPSLENFQNYFAIMWNEYNCVVVWIFFGIALLWDWNENWLFFFFFFRFNWFFIFYLFIFE